MVITVVTFPTGDNNYEQMTKLFKGSVSKYQEAASAGLMRKNYLLTEDGNTAGGVYLWESKDKAELFFNDSWREYFKDRYGIYPEVSYFNTPIEVDNTNNKVSTWV
jgi:hypothetical protein